MPAALQRRAGNDRVRPVEDVQVGGAPGQPAGRLDIEALKERVAFIEGRLHRSVLDLLESQRVRIIAGTARLKGPHEVVVAAPSGERSRGASRARNQVCGDQSSVSSGTRE